MNFQRIPEADNNNILDCAFVVGVKAKSRNFGNSSSEKKFEIRASGAKGE